MVYLDYSATTPVLPEVLDSYNKVTEEYFGNPNSLHSLGVKAHELLESANKQVSELLNIKEDEFFYTSGATESNNLAIIGAALTYKRYGNRILVSTMEHPSIYGICKHLEKLGFIIDYVNVTNEGVIDFDDLKNKVTKDTILVSICAVNSEVGARQPLKTVRQVIRKNNENCILHSDMTQAIGKVNIDYSDVDLITITPHKFYGLSGVGILIKRDNVFLIPQINGGKSSTIYRSGTPDTALIASASIALKKSLENMEERRISVIDKNKKIVEYLKGKKNVTINSNDNSIPYIINFSVQNRKSNDLQKLFNDSEIYVSTKTSCCPIETPSKLVYAVTKNKSLASSSIRISLSHLTTNAEIDKFIEVMNNIIG